MKQIKMQIREEIKTIPTEEYAPDHRPIALNADLSLNINPFGVSEKVTKRLKSLDASKIFHYYLENKKLLGLIADYIQVKPENILIGDGCDGCLEMIAKTFIAKNDSVIIPIPTFHRYEFHTKLMGGKAVLVPMENFLLNAETVLKEANQNSSKLVFLCNPNNPTGMELDQKEKIELIKHFRGLIVIDEALADITSVNESRLISEHKNLIIVRSFSKSFGFASLRIGYIVADKEVINYIKKVSSPFKVNGVAQELAVEALQDQGHIQDSIKFLKEEREYLIAELEQIGLLCTKSTTTNFLVNVAKLGQVKSIIQRLTEKKVLVTDAGFFRVPEEKYIRIAVSSKEENKYFIKAIKEIANS